MSKIVGLGTADSSKVLTGETFTSGSGANQTGTMPNNGSPTLNPGDSIASGYYGGGSVNTQPHGSQVFTSTGTFTVPANVNSFIAIIVGGGGGSGGAVTGNADNSGQPGQDGEVLAVQYTNVTAGSTYQITAIGAGGSGADGSGYTQGNSGGQTSFDGHVASGGEGGWSIDGAGYSWNYDVGSIPGGWGLNNNHGKGGDGVQTNTGTTAIPGNSGNQGAVVIYW